MDFIFFMNSALLGLGLAMDAFSVSLADGLHEPSMSRKKCLSVAGVFAFFQAAMPLLGWVAVHTILSVFSALEKFIPLTALLLLAFIGGKMIYEAMHECPPGDEACELRKKLSLRLLLVQGVATSIDALSVGFTIATYDFLHALVSCLVIAFVTFFICLGGIHIGKKFGVALSRKAGIFGGVILILIGLEIFLSSLFS